MPRTPHHFDALYDQSNRASSTTQRSHQSGRGRFRWKPLGGPLETSTKECASRDSKGVGAVRTRTFSGRGLRALIIAFTCCPPQPSANWRKSKASHQQLPHIYEWWMKSARHGRFMLTPGDQGNAGRPRASRSSHPSRRGRRFARCKAACWNATSRRASRNGIESAKPEWSPRSAKDIPRSRPVSRLHRPWTAARSTEGDIIAFFRKVRSVPQLVAANREP